MDTLFYEGFFARDSLLWADSLFFRDCHEVSATSEVPVPLMPETLHRNDIVSVTLLVSFLLLVLLWRRHSLRFCNQEELEISSGEGLRVVLALVTSLLVGLLSLVFFQMGESFGAAPLPTPVLFVLCTVGTFLLFVAKQWLYGFVHTVFFTPSQCRQWLEGFTVILTVECLLLFPLALSAVYFDLTPENIVYGLAGMLLFVKTWLLVQCFSTFFGKIYGSLHLFVYFCALEALPLLILGTTLVILTQHLTSLF